MLNKQPPYIHPGHFAAMDSSVNQEEKKTLFDILDSKGPSYCNFGQELVQPPIPGHCHCSTMVKKVSIRTTVAVGKELHLSNDQDRITWRWTSNGEYSANSAQQIQHTGSSSWKAHAEGKDKFFARLLVQCKLLTEDRLSTRQLPCSPVCVLCNQRQETESRARDSNTSCPSLQFWQRGLGKNSSTASTGLIEVPDQEQRVMEWWQELAKLPRKTRHTKVVILIFNLWKSFFYR